MKKLLVLPTWILLGLMKPSLSKEHPWKNKKFTLTDWAKHSTDMNNYFSFLFWIGIAGLFFSLYMIYAYL